MGHKRMLQRTEYCVMLGTCTESSTQDRFSNLSIEVAHHILSFLSFKYLTRASAVSKRCRQLYLSNPTVSFDAISIPSCNRRRGELYNSLDTFLTNRGDNRIQCFRIRWLFVDFESPRELIDDHYRVITWIHNAIRCKVEELDLDFTLFGMTIFAFLSCILLCPSSRPLSLNLRGTTLQVPSLYFSCNLRHLTLRDVTFVDGRFCTWPSSSCRSIKELQLIQVKEMQNISIESSSLESLKLVSGNNGDLFYLNISGEKLEEIHIAWKNVSSSPRSTSLMISAPNLKKLKLECHLTNRLKFWKHTTLEKAEILLWPKANECGNIFDVLRSVRNAKTVILNDQETKALFGKGSVMEPLHDICNLGLHLRSLNDDIVPAVVSLFRAETNLNTLHIKCSIFACGGQCDSSPFDTNYWKVQNLGLINQLKKVTIEPFYGPNENEFAKYILEHAQNLKKMVISYLKEKQSDVVAGMVSKGNMISSTAKVVLRESRLACLS